MKLPLALIIAPCIAHADPKVEAALEDHILPRVAVFADATGVMAAADTCDIAQHWYDASEAWIAMSHLRFGPSEVDNRAFAIAFWPDPRGSTPTALRRLLAADAPVIADASIAGRGLYAIEFLLFDDAFVQADGRCDLIAALADDAHATALAIQNDWQNRYADLMRTTGNDIYRDDTEALQELYKSLTTGLDFTTTMRLGRPLGTFDRPRPNRAEMRRSGRSLDNVSISLESLGALALILSDAETAPAIEDLFHTAHDQIAAIRLRDDAATLGLVARPTDRIQVEGLQQRVSEIRVFLGETVGPELGVIEGFNSLDGD